VWYASSVRIRDVDKSCDEMTIEIKLLPGDTQLMAVSGDPAEYKAVRVSNMGSKTVDFVAFEFGAATVKHDPQDVPQ